MSGKATTGQRPGEWEVNYASSCLDPVPIRRIADSGALLADLKVPCRRCEPCRRRRMGHWAYRAIAETRQAVEEGRRTWFGTLTLKPEAVSETLDRAIWEYSDSGEIAEFWSDPLCDFRFKLHRAVLLEELKKYWKRLRKAGHTFKYLAVFERHKSGVPHIHWLLHEKGSSIRKKDLQAQWPHGFTKVKLVGKYDKRRRRKLTPEFACFYVVKYLHKHEQSRQLGSIAYGKTNRPHDEAKLRSNVDRSARG